MQRILGTAPRGYLGLLDEILRNAARRALLSSAPVGIRFALTQAAAEYQ